jgi:hypothetical protein
MKVKQISKEFLISGKKGFNVLLRINEGHIELEKPNKDFDFVFKSGKSLETLERWETILKLLLDAVRFAKKEI